MNDARGAAYKSSYRALGSGSSFTSVKSERRAEVGLGCSLAGAVCSWCGVRSPERSRGTVAVPGKDKVSVRDVSDVRDDGAPLMEEEEDRTLGSRLNTEHMSSGRQYFMGEGRNVRRDDCWEGKGAVSPQDNEPGMEWNEVNGEGCC